MGVKPELVILHDDPTQALGPWTLLPTAPPQPSGCSPGVCRCAAPEGLGPGVARAERWLPCSPQATLITEYSSVVQPVQLAFQQQIQTLKTQHEEFVSSLTQQQQQQQQQIQMPQMEADVKATPPPPAPPPAPTPAPAIPPTTQPGTWLPQRPPPGGSLQKAVFSPRKGSGSVISGPVLGSGSNLLKSTRQVISRVNVTQPLHLRQLYTNHPREWRGRPSKSFSRPG